MTATEWAYIAGFMDGEGTFGLTADQLSGRDGSVRSHRFGVSVTVVNTDRRPLDFIRRLTGTGDIRWQEGHDGHKDCYRWRCPRSEVKRFVQGVLPFLIIKAGQAGLLLEFICLQDEGRRGGHKGLALADVPAALAIYTQVRELNRRGTAVDEIEAPVFTVGEGKPRETICEEAGCDDRRYHRGPWCYKHWMLNKAPDLKHCIQCGARFESRNVLRKYCSDRCQAAHTWDVTKGKDRDRHTLITEEQVRQAIEMLLTGTHTQTDAANALGVDRAALGEILRGRSRKEWKLDLPSKEQLKAGHEVWRKRREETTVKQCEQCDAEFHPKNGKMRFCGRGCYWTAEKARRREAYAAGR